MTSLSLSKICGRRFGPSGEFLVDFVVGGDGPKRILFEEMIEQHHLQVRYTVTVMASTHDIIDNYLLPFHLYAGPRVDAGRAAALRRAGRVAGARGRLPQHVAHGGQMANLPLMQGTSLPSVTDLLLNLPFAELVKVNPKSKLQTLRPGLGFHP